MVVVVGGDGDGNGCIGGGVGHGGNRDDGIICYDHDGGGVGGSDDNYYWLWK